MEYSELWEKVRGYVGEGEPFNVATRPKYPCRWCGRILPVREQAMKDGCLGYYVRCPEHGKTEVRSLEVAKVFADCEII